VATTPGNSWILLEPPGNGFASWKNSWKVINLLENSWKQLFVY